MISPAPSLPSSPGATVLGNHALVVHVYSAESFLVFLDLSFQQESIMSKAPKLLSLPCSGEYTEMADV